MHKIGLLSVCALILLSSIAFANPPMVRNDHPDHYTVQKGDTLWDISAKFLQNPWQWPSIWKKNPQINDPHWIYPGDVLVFTHIDGQPILAKTFPKDGKLFTKRPPIPAITPQRIEPFLDRSMVFDDETLNGAAYVVSYANEHLIGGAGHEIYAQGVSNGPDREYAIFRDDGVYKDPVSHEILGYAAKHVGDARITEAGSPATLLLTSTTQEVLVGDRLIAKSQIHYTPVRTLQLPKADIDGQIISVLGGISQIGQYHAVVIDRGSADGVNQGDILCITTPGNYVQDPIYPDKEVRLPQRTIGELMIFCTFNRVSFGLVMHATRPIHLLDSVSNPVV